MRLTLSRSLAHRKVRYSVQQSALSPVASALPVCHLQRLSLSKAVAKVQTFSVSATFTPYFFAGFFQAIASLDDLRYAIKHIFYCYAEIRVKSPTLYNSCGHVRVRA